MLDPPANHSDRWETVVSPPTLDSRSGVRNLTAGTRGTVTEPHGSRVARDEAISRSASRPKTVVVALFVALTAAALYAPGLDGGLYVDEPNQHAKGLEIIDGSPDELWVHPPLVLYFAGLGASFDRRSPVALRAPTLLFSIGCIVLLVLALARVAPLWFAALAGSHLASVALFGHLSVRAMLDVYLAFFVLSFLLLFRAHVLQAQPTRFFQSRIFWCGAAGAAAMACKAYAMFFFVVPALFVLFVLPERDRTTERPSLFSWRPPKEVWRFSAGFALATFVIYLPYHFTWVPLEPEKYAQLSQWVPAIPASAKNLYVQLATYLAVTSDRFVHEIDGQYVTSYPWWGYLRWGFASLGLLLPIAFVAPFLRKKTSRREDLAFLAMWTSVIFTFVVVSMVSTKTERYFLVFVPPFILFAYEALSTRWTHRSRPPAWIAASLVLVIGWHAAATTSRAQEFRADSGMTSIAERIVEIGARTQGETRVLVHEANLLEFALLEHDAGDITLVEFCRYVYLSSLDLADPSREPEPLPRELTEGTVHVVVVPVDAFPTPGILRIRKQALAEERHRDWMLYELEVTETNPPLEP